MSLNFVSCLVCKVIPPSQKKELSRTRFFSSLQVECAQRCLQAEINGTQNPHTWSSSILFIFLFLPQFFVSSLASCSFFSLQFLFLVPFLAYILWHLWHLLTLVGKCFCILWYQSLVGISTSYVFGYLLRC